MRAYKVGSEMIGLMPAVLIATAISTAILIHEKPEVEQSVEPTNTIMVDCQMEKLELIAEREELKAEIISNDLDSITNYQRKDYKAVLHNLNEIVKASIELQVVYDKMIEVERQ